MVDLVFAAFTVMPDPSSGNPENATGAPLMAVNLKYLSSTRKKPAQSKPSANFIASSECSAISPIVSAKAS
jgi:hypothetical protein